jgi:hypothetical protein
MPVLYTQKLLAELERKRGHFTGYSERFGRQLGQYQSALASLATRFPSAATLDDALSAAQASASQPLSLGARPSAEYDTWRASGEVGIPALRFGESFAHHEAARAWAERLRGITTLAVDGSQLMPWRDASVPVALVQAGIFENPHTPPTPYLKDVVTEVLTPEDLLGGEGQDGDTRTGELLGYSEREVHLRRFELELRTLIARMEHHTEQRHASQRPAGGSSAPSVVALYDGSLTVSFAQKMPDGYKDRYIRAAQGLLAASERCRIPVVGYIDTSYARDLATMLRALSPVTDPLPEPRGVHDALLLGGSLGWGDRTPAFLAARASATGLSSGERSRSIAFVYFQAALDRPPARLELPGWVLDAGQLDAVMDVVRAEVIVGNGYPYPIEAADAVAVISLEDRRQFYALFQEWADREELPFTFSRKALSKSRRRV